MEKLEERIEDLEEVVGHLVLMVDIPDEDVVNLMAKLGEEEQSEKNIIDWIQDKKDEVEDRLSELRDRSCLYPTEDREYGHLRAKRNLLDQLEDFIEEAE